MKRTILLALILISGLKAQSQIIKYNKASVNNSDSPLNKRELMPSDITKQNMFSMSVTDLVLTNITLRYEFFKKDGTVSYQIPFSFNAGGIPDTNNYRVSNAGRFLSGRNRIFQTGFNLNYYIDGQDVVSPFVGVSLAAGWFYYWKYSNTPLNVPPYNAWTSEKMIANNYSFAFHAGFLYNPWETLTFSAKIGAGLRRYGTIYQEYTYPFGLADLSIGFKF